MNRTVIRPLQAWDVEVHTLEVLPPGSSLSACQILRSTAPGGEPYVMEFNFAGRRYACPLFAFQPRTQTFADGLDPASRG